VLATPAIPPVFPDVNPEMEEGGWRGVVKMFWIKLDALCAGAVAPGPGVGVYGPDD